MATGINLLDNVIKKEQAAGSRVISGSEAFLLYDTYGFPIDLTELIAQENGMTVNGEEFSAELQKQKSVRATRRRRYRRLGRTVPIAESRFIGYDTLESDVRISRYRRVTAKNKTYYQLVFDQTPFYGNSAGRPATAGTSRATNRRFRSPIPKRRTT